MKPDQEILYLFRSITCYSSLFYSIRGKVWLLDCSFSLTRGADSVCIIDSTKELIIMAAIKENDDSTTNVNKVGTLIKISEEKDQTYFGYYGMLMHQQNMLLDTVRTSTYYDAIIGNLQDFSGKIVLDVGAGTGILSFFAIQAGAKHVYAVEASDMAEKAKALAKANGLSDRITVIAGRIEQVSLPEMVDVIVSEPMGVLLVHERMMESLLVGRDRFLKPEALNKSNSMFPSTGTVYFAPFTDLALYADAAQKMEFWRNNHFYGINLNCLLEPAIQGYFGQAVVGPIDSKSLLAPAILRQFDFLRLPVADFQSFKIDLQFIAHSTGIIHGLAGWFDVSFQGSTLQRTLSTSPWHDTTHWYQVRFLFVNPIAINQGQRLSGSIAFQANNQRSHTISIDVVLEGTFIRLYQTFAMQDQLYWNLSGASTTLNKEMLAIYDGLITK